MCSDAFPSVNIQFIDVVGCVSEGEACANTNDCGNVLTMGNGLITNQQCTGHQQANSGGTAEIQSVCCAATSDEETMECQQIVGSATGSANDASSEISCKETLGTEWFLTSCGEYVQTTVASPRVDGHFSSYATTANNDVCMVKNSGFNGVTYPVAQCCRIGIVDYIDVMVKTCKTDDFEYEQKREIRLQSLHQNQLQNLLQNQLQSQLNHQHKRQQMFHQYHQLWMDVILI